MHVLDRLPLRWIAAIWVGGLIVVVGLARFGDAPAAPQSSPSMVAAPDPATPAPPAPTASDRPTASPAPPVVTASPGPPRLTRPAAGALLPASGTLEVSGEDATGIVEIEVVSDGSVIGRATTTAHSHGAFASLVRIRPPPLGGPVEVAAVLASGHRLRAPIRLEQPLPVVLWNAVPDVVRDASLLQLDGLARPEVDRVEVTLADGGGPIERVVAEPEDLDGSPTWRRWAAVFRLAPGLPCEDVAWTAVATDERGRPLVELDGSFALFERRSGCL
jgi:hypothetical protein